MKIAVVSHDAGSSEILCALIREYFDLYSWHIFALPQSPMGRACERYNLPFTPIGDPEQQLRDIQPDLLLFGTGWQEKIERPFVRFCKEHAIATVAFLDHWSNYRERFGFPDEGWEENLGDFTAVHDERGYSLALSMDLPNPLKLPNHYLIRLIEEAVQRKVEVGKTLLFLSEPTDSVAQKTYGDPLYWGFTQYTALEDILEHFEDFQCEDLIIRLHPSEKSSNYDAILERYSNISVQIHDIHSVDLIDELLYAKVIIGFDTMALYIAALLGKSVISYLPTKAREFLLPLPKNRQLNHLSNLSNELLLGCSLHMDKFGMDFATFINTVKKVD